MKGARTLRTFLDKYGDTTITTALILLFAAWPNIDLALASLFYEPEIGFPAKNIWWIKVVYETTARLWVFFFLFVVLLLASYLPSLRSRWLQRRKAMFFLIVALLVGPGLIANSLFKNHWGRPRPVHLEQFGGTAKFTPVLVLNKQCPTNCSLPSGHAAGAFFVMAGYWITRRRVWLASGITFGLFVGYTRMAMGAHFLSDIFFSGLIVYFTCKWLARLFGLVPKAERHSGALQPVKSVP